MWLLIVPSLLLWAFGLSVALLGTVYALRRFAKQEVSPSGPAGSLPSISILKPLKGLEDGMQTSLRTFFQLDYPDYEILFCVADADDSAIPVIRKLMAEFTHIPSRLHIGAASAGANPKVNNLIPVYDRALHDRILISDSNVRVPPCYLRRMVSVMANDVGIVTAVVAGMEPSHWGGRLEAVYLNTFVARWMQIAYAIGHPCVMGKTMLFRRSVLDRFGGLKTLSRYVAEDYMAGQAMLRLGFRTEVISQPVGQYIGDHSFQDFWRRHLRWGRIRRSQSPPGFFLEPFQYALGSGLLGAFGLWAGFGLSFFSVLFIHFFLWGLADSLLIFRLEGKFSYQTAIAWCVRELIALPHWVHMACGRSILWRGHRLRILNGGLVQA